LISLDSRVRGNDENGSFLTFYEFVNIENSGILPGLIYQQLVLSLLPFSFAFTSKA